MLKIYHAPLSSASNRVRFCAAAIGIEHEAIAVNLARGEQRAESYLEINPFGKVPAIDDDGFYLFESNAIMKYLCRKHSSALYPDTRDAQALVDQWCDFAASLLGPAYGRLVYNRLLAPATGARVDEASLADGLRFIGRYLPVMDEHLARNEHLAAPSLTIADIAVLATLDPSEACKVELSEYPALQKWREQLRAAPFYQAVHRYYGEGALDSAPS